MLQLFLEFYDKVIRFFAFLWRSFGSPRIAGDEKAVGAAKNLWSKKNHARAAGTSLPARTRNAIIAVSGVVVAILLVWLVFTLVLRDEESDGPELATAPTPTPFAGPAYLTEIQAIDHALQAARDNGLESSEFEQIARRVTFGEFAEAIGQRDRAERGLLEAPTETEVWAVAFAGDVELGLSNGESVVYDNLNVILDALTAQVYRVEAFYGDYESEVRAPVWLRPPTPTPLPSVLEVPN